MDSLITIIIFVAIAIFSSWIKRRQQADEESENWPGEKAPPPQTPPSPRRPTKSVNWEEELRRLLEGKEAAPPQSPPPLIVYEKRPSPAAPPPPLPRQPRQPLAPKVPRLVVPVEEEGETGMGLPVHLPSLTESSTAYSRASQLDVKVAEHLRRVSSQLAKRPPVSGRRAESREHPRLAWLADRASLRAAFVASVALGPPKALEGMKGPE